LNWSARLFALILLLTAACSQAGPVAPVSVQLQTDGKLLQVALTPGVTVQRLLDQSGVKLNPADRVEPSIFTILNGGETVRLIRVKETFETARQPVPFEKQTLQNESLPAGQEVLVQKGRNGVQEITYRRLFEDGVEVTDRPEPVKTVLLESPQPEIVMTGIQAPAFSVPIPGKIIYVRDGIAWLMQGNTSSRRALINAGDLDGRILSLSSDGTWLLFSRRLKESEGINSLWAADLSAKSIELIDLKVKNVIHFADWVPGSNTRILFSTVEPRNSPPGWQANNDLAGLTFSSTGWTTKWTMILDPNAGGIYGWWGTGFEWSPDGASLAYNRPDQIGIVDLKAGTLKPVVHVTPFQTRSDWVWSPGVRWSPDSKTLFTTDHPPASGLANPESSPRFDLTVASLSGQPQTALVMDTGMFAYPLSSPIQTINGKSAYYQLAYLQAALPSQSDTSRYRVMISDSDGKNSRAVFPREETAGLSPQPNWGVWSPAALASGGSYHLAIIHKGQLWLVDASTGESQQITGDGLTTRVIWK
jgi:hypothetical protein